MSNKLSFYFLKAGGGEGEGGRQTHGGCTGGQTVSVQVSEARRHQTDAQTQPDEWNIKVLPTRQTDGNVGMWSDGRG